MKIRWRFYNYKKKKREKTQYCDFVLPFVSKFEWLSAFGNLIWNLFTHYSVCVIVNIFLSIFLLSILFCIITHFFFYVYIYIYICLKFCYLFCVFELNPYWLTKLSKESNFRTCIISSSYISTSSYSTMKTDREK